jgi:hypothetical protein
MSGIRIPIAPSVPAPPVASLAAETPSRDASASAAPLRSGNSFLDQRVFPSATRVRRFTHSLRPEEPTATLLLSQRHDPKERIADQVASDILSAKHPLASEFQRSSGARNTAADIPGRLRTKDQREFEAHLNRDLRDVRLHTDVEAANHCAAVGARAFTLGRDIYFGWGQYQPETPSGRWLLAHEVAHTLERHEPTLARFVADAPIPVTNVSAPESGDDPGFQSAEAVACDLDNALGVDPTDTSGQASRRLARLAPAQRGPALSALRAKTPRSRESRVAHALASPPAAQRSPEAAPTGELLSAPPRARGSAEESRSRDRNRSLPDRSTPGGVEGMPPRPGRPPQPPSVAAPPGTTREAPTPPSPGPTAAPSSRAARPASEAAGRTKPGRGTEDSKSDAPAQAGGPSAQDDGPLRLSDLFEEAQPAPPSNAEAEVGGLPSTGPELAGAGDAASIDPLAGGATIPLVFGAVPNEEASASSEENVEEVPDPAEIEAEMEALAVELEEALPEARTSLQDQAVATRSRVLGYAASARAGIRAEVDRTVAAIETGGSQLLQHLQTSVDSAHGQVDVALAARLAEASTAGTNSQRTILGIFSGHRTTVSNTVTHYTAEAERLRTRKVNGARDRNRADIRRAYAKARVKMNALPGTNRGAYMGSAAFDVAEGTANEMRDQEPDIVSGVGELIAPLPELFRSQGAEALDGFDVNLPEILASVSEGVGHTRAEILEQAVAAHRELEHLAQQSRAEIDGLLQEAIGQARDVGPQVESYLDRGLGEVLRTVSAAPATTLNRVSPPIEEATELFRTVEDPDVEAAEQLTETLGSFLDDSVDAQGSLLESAADASQRRFRQLVVGARQTLRAHKQRCDQVWQTAGSGVNTTLARAVETADAGLGGTVAFFNRSLRETEASIRTQLQPAVTQLRGGFRDHLTDTEGRIDERIHEAFAKNSEALADLDGKMDEAASEAGWEYDHPVLSALAFIAGILVGILKVLALLLVVLLVVFLLAKILAVSMIVAGIVLLVGMVAFAIGYGFGARLAAGQGVGEAFTGAVVDFGRSAPGMLYDMTGIPKLRRAFSDERMSSYERGKLIGEGGTEFVLAIFMVRGAAKGVAGRFRSLPRVPAPGRPPPVAGPAARPTPPVEPVRPPAPASTPRPTAPVEAPRPTPPVEPPAPSRPRLEVIQGGRGRPTVPEAPVEPVRPPPPLEPVPRSGPRAPAREPLRVIEGGAEPSTTPSSRPRLEVIEGGRSPGARTPRTSEPVPAEAQPQRAAMAAGAEGNEPILGELAPPRRLGVVQGEGGLRPGGRSSMDPVASAQRPPGGGSSPRPPTSSGAGRSGGARGSSGPGPEGAGSGRGGGPRPGRTRPSTAEEPGPATSEGSIARPSATRAPTAPRPKPRNPRSSAPKRSRTGERGEGGRRRSSRRSRRGDEPRPTKAERQAQARRDADSRAAQREFEGLDRSPTREPSAEDVLSGRADPARSPGTVEGGDMGGATVRRGPGGREIVPEDRVVAEAAGSAFERPMVQEFAAAQPASARTFGSSLGNWRALRTRYPRLAELFGGGSRPDAVSVDPVNRRINLFDATSRPNATHLDGSAEYMQRVLDDPIAQRIFDGWEITVRERYWEYGFRRASPTRSARIGGPRTPR